MKKKSIIIISAAVFALAATIATTLVGRYSFDKVPIAENLPASTVQAQEEAENEQPTAAKNVSEAHSEKADAAQAKKPNKAAASAAKVISTTKAAAEKATEKCGKLFSVSELIGPEGDEFLGYRYDPEGDFYYTDDKECWQVNAGYNEIYDKMAAAVFMHIDQLRLRFTYEEKDWMIEFWKGQYGTMLIGAEIGVYTAEAGTYTGATGDVNHYNCAGKEDWLNMQLDCYWAENNNGHYKKIFTREYGKYWWATGFVDGCLTKYTPPRSELKVKARITLKSEEMANLVVTALRQSGFVRAGGSAALIDDSYYQKSADVWVLWSTVQHDAFAGYEK